MHTLRTISLSLLLYLSTAVLVAPLFWPVLAWCFNDLHLRLCEDVGKAIGYSGGLFLFIPWGICALIICSIALVSFVRKRRGHQLPLTKSQNNTLRFAALLVAVEVCLVLLSLKLSP